MIREKAGLLPHTEVAFEYDGKDVRIVRVAGKSASRGREIVEREHLEDALAPALFHREPIPWEAAFLAGKVFLNDRRRGGEKRAPLPDFYIGAHAAVAGYRLLTRDVARYRTDFPSVGLICPG